MGARVVLGWADTRGGQLTLPARAPSDAASGPGPVLCVATAVPA